MSTRIALGFLLLVVAWVGLRIAIAQLSGTPSAGGPVLDNGPPRLMDCPDSPNCQSSFATRESQLVEPFDVDPSVNDRGLMQRIVSRLVDDSSVEVASQTEDYAHLVFQSRVFGFRDDVELLVDAERGVVHVRSASRVGYSDFGANRRRIETLRETLRPVLQDA